MAALSNFFRPRDRRGGDGNPAPSVPPVPPTTTVEYRLVQRGEIEPSLRLILGGTRGHAADEQVLDFLTFAIARKIDVNQIWLAAIDGSIEWALLPVNSPGRTTLLFSPARLPRRRHRHVIGALTGRVLSQQAKAGVLLVQLLLDPADKDVIAIYLAAGFERLADLAYLQADVRGTEPLPPLPVGWSMRTYEASAHAAFADTIARTYEGSRDCPTLNGKREIDDIIAGHQASGDFDPKLWFLLSDESGQSLGTLLLSRTAGNGQVELVYVGLVPQARGRGVGDLLIRWSLAVVGLENRRHLSLAVDAANQPALRLYFRHGFSRVGSRVALIRDLRERPICVTDGEADGSDPVEPTREQARG
jgi:GNAT superfamily N-acetyltransferase